MQKKAKMDLTQPLEQHIDPPVPVIFYRKVGNYISKRVKHANVLTVCVDQLVFS